jgi:Zn-dependent alcohol dehydrogenase
VLIKICACALVAPEEEKCRRSLIKTSKEDGESAVVHIGQDIAGVVKAIGSDVCTLRVGERVVGEYIQWSKFYGIFTSNF